MVRKAQSEGRRIGAVGTRVKGAFNSALMSEKDTELAKKDYVSSYLKDDSAVISILADYVPGYDVTLDPFEVDEKTVLIGRNGAYEITDEQRKAAEEYMIDRLDKALPETQTPALTEYQQRSLSLQEDAGKRAERGLDIQEQRISQTTAEDEPVSYESGLSAFVNNAGDTIRSSTFVKSIKEDNFNEENIIDTTENFDALFEMQNLSNASIKPVKKNLGLKDVVVSVSGGGTGGVGTKTIKKEVIKDAVEVFVPEYMDKPLLIPQSEILGENLHEVIKVIDKARRNKTKIKEIDFETIFEKDIYNDYNTQKTGSMGDFN